jgi:thiol-disulfide isomerase/thioredoxin
LTLDFWASWCGPCIKGIPDIKNIYNKHNKNLKIIGISLDQNKEDWQKAVNEHQIEIWPQILSNYVLDNNYFRNEMDLTEIYNVKIIPTYIFIDMQGKVIAVWHSIGKEELSEIDKILK